MQTLFQQAWGQARDAAFLTSPQVLPSLSGHGSLWEQQVSISTQMAKVLERYPKLQQHCLPWANYLFYHQNSTNKNSFPFLLSSHPQSQDQPRTHVAPHSTFLLSLYLLHCFLDSFTCSIPKPALSPFKWFSGLLPLDQGVAHLCPPQMCSLTTVCTIS